MRNLRIVGLGIVALGLLAGCRGGSAPSVLPMAGSAARSGTENCTPAQTLTVCVHIPQSGAQVKVIDTVGGDGSAEVGQTTCPPSGNAHVCVASFSPPQGTLNQIAIESSGAIKASGTFPVFVGNLRSRKTATPQQVVLEGSSLATISKIAAVPFQVSRPGQLSRLSLGQTESVWIVATDAQQEVIVGQYQHPISIKTTSNLTSSLPTLSTTSDAEKLTVFWNGAFTGSSGSGSGSGSGKLIATETGHSVAGTADLRATSGVVYDQVGSNSAALGPGPVALSPDGKEVYFVINDDSDGGCRKPPNCATKLGRFTPSGPSGPSVSYVSLASVPGVSQLYVSSNGALWMATFQPVGTWGSDLPALRMPPSKFSTSDLQTLPSSTFGSPSGFVQAGAKNLWISSCIGSICKQNQNGEPVLVKTGIDGTPKAEKTVALPMSCLQYGYFGYSVGDVASYYQGDLYVLGINDGSAPPARGNVWRVSTTTYVPSCVDDVPYNFNPSPYFSSVSDAANAPALVVGAGGNNANYRWQPDHGFYALREQGSSNSVTWDNGPAVTANHVSAYAPPSAPPGSLLYYASSGKLDLRFPGLGTYQPSANPSTLPSEWSIFPSASFSGNQADNGVAATKYGAWYTANGVCGKPWRGVCLAHAIYLSDKYWGVLPSLILPAIAKNNSSAFGVITDPQGIGSGVSPLGAHSGPFYTQELDPKICTIGYVKGGAGHAQLIFGVTGISAGICRITITNKNTKLSQYLVTNVTQP